MKHTYAKALVKKVTDDGKLLGVVGSTATVDRYGESIDQKTWQLDHYKSNPVILWAHNLSFGEDRPPIGKAIDVRIEKGVLKFDIQFDMKDEFAADIHRKYKEGFLNTFSVGFISHKRMMTDDGVPTLMDNELLELSAVPVPANPDALQALRSRSFASRSWESLMKTADNEADKLDEQVVDETPVKPSDENIVTPDSLDEGSKGQQKAQAAEPTSPKLGVTSAQLVGVLRETSRQLQGILTAVNAAQRQNSR